MKIRFWNQSYKTTNGRKLGSLARSKAVYREQNKLDNLAMQILTNTKRNNHRHAVECELISANYQIQQIHSKMYSVYSVQEHYIMFDFVFSEIVKKEQRDSQSKFGFYKIFIFCEEHVRFLTKHFQCFLVFIFICLLVFHKNKKVFLRQFAKGQLLFFVKCSYFF